MSSSKDPAQPKKLHLGISLVAWWLRLFSPNAGGPGLIPSEGTRGLMLQVRPGADKKKKYIYIYIYIYIWHLSVRKKNVSSIKKVENECCFICAVCFTTLKRKPISHAVESSRMAKDYVCRLLKQWDHSAHSLRCLDFSYNPSSRTVSVSGPKVSLIIFNSCIVFCRMDVQLDLAQSC